MITAIRIWISDLLLAMSVVVLPKGVWHYKVLDNWVQNYFGIHPENRR